MPAPILFERRGNFAHVTLNRPRSGNLVNAAVIDALAKGVDELSRDQGCFCAARARTSAWAAIHGQDDGGHRSRRGRCTSASRNESSVSTLPFAAARYL